MDRRRIIEVLSSWNFWGEGIETGIERSIYVNRICSYLKGVNKVVSIFGIRRAGKSYILRQVNKAISNRIGVKNVLYVNFEEMLFPVRLDKEFLIEVYEVYRDFIKPEKQPLIILDEVQEVKYWEKFVRSIHERNEARIIVSGSSAKLMAEEFETILAGRTITLEIYPLSFREFLMFKNIDLPENELLLRPRAIRGMLNYYLNFGGFPEIVLEESEGKRREIVRNYWETIVIKDIEKRFRVRSDVALRAVGRFLISNPSALISFRKISRSIEVPVKTVERFTKYFQVARVINLIPKFSFSVREQERAPRKNYLTDISFFTLLGFRFMENIGKIIENIVAVELLRRKNFTPEYEIYYWRDPQQHEVDFVVKKGAKIEHLIQVAYANDVDEIDRREIRSLIKASKQLGCRNMQIITWNLEDEIEYKGNKIKLTPLWKWLITSFPP